MELKKLIKTTKVVKFVEKNMKRSQVLFVTTFEHHSYKFSIKNIQGGFGIFISFLNRLCLFATKVGWIPEHGFDTLRLRMV